MIRIGIVRWKVAVHGEILDSVEDFTGLAYEESIGQIVDEADEYVILALHRFPKDNSWRQYAAIPKACFVCPMEVIERG